MFTQQSKTSSSYELIALKNGEKVSKPTITPTMDLLEKDDRFTQTVLNELFNHCLDPEYKMSESTIKLIKEVGFTTGHGAIHKITKAIIISALENDGSKITVRNPRDEIIKLNNDTQVPSLAIANTMKNLHALEVHPKSNPFLFYELLEKCRDPEYKIWHSNMEELFTQVGIMIASKIDEDTRNIILSAVKSDGMFCKISLPTEKSAAPTPATHHDSSSPPSLLRKLSIHTNQTPAGDGQTSINEIHVPRLD